MLFIQQLSVLSLLISSAFAAVIPQDKATKAANLKRVIADRQYKRSSIGKRTTLPAPQVSQAYCAGYRNLAGICVEKCDFSLANVIQKQSGGCQCTDGFEQIGLSCLAICLPNFTRNLSTNQCGCNTNTFDLLSSGACVAKCSTSQDRVNGSCQPKCIGNVIRGTSGACDSCQNSSTSFLSQVFSATTGLVTSANCVNKCSLPFPLYAQNPSGGCLGNVGAPCKGNGVTCSNGLSCGFLSGVCALGI